MAASQNNGALKIFKFNGAVTFLKPKTITDKFNFTTLPNGKKRKEEFYYGTSFLSQSARFMMVNH